MIFYNDHEPQEKINILCNLLCAVGHKLKADGEDAVGFALQQDVSRLHDNKIMSVSKKQNELEQLFECVIFEFKLTNF